MATLFSVIDPRGFSVICATERFQDHILSESGHEEMRGHEASMERTVVDPIAIYRDADYATRDVYYRPSDLPAPYERGFVRVVVGFSQVTGGGRSGTVITAYHAYRPKTAEVLLWSRT